MSHDLSWGPATNTPQVVGQVVAAIWTLLHQRDWMTLGGTLGWLTLIALMIWDLRRDGYDV